MISSEISIEVPQRQQSARRNHIRTDMGQRHSGQAQKTISPSSQMGTKAAWLAARAGSHAWQVIWATC
ncbi:MAG: hypothetical protein GTO53_02490 [Planctomycetales bacterium]|nr:hypothetical protein [Planctomycetales bacterium]NIM08037.1 hypothetical protein [Planctomycetales bacterium]NIN07528.1 hypothetical protein [Planctomycetales bacterium]NIN76635.1 hypothetical protein [Planctomycetales bacterium]NIO33822.1 hypothetical protein [Planctomycetales bacterium]